jgi:hypothetical protein
VLGAAGHPLNTADFGSFLLQAQASHAKVVGLANSAGDTINPIKQAQEFGTTQKGQKLAALLFFYHRRGRRQPPHRPGRITHGGILSGSQPRDPHLELTLCRAQRWPHAL